MRILMISVDRGLFGGGASGDVLSRHKKYAKHVGHLDIIVFADRSYEQKKIDDNIRVFPTRSGKFQHFKKAAALAKVLMKENKYDLLVTQDFAAPAGEMLKKEFGIPWIVSIHGMFFSTEWLGLHPMHWYLLYRIKKAIRKADGFRVNNQIIAAKLKEWGMEKPVLVQPTAIEISKFQIVNRKLQTNPKQQITLLFVGRLSPEKNIQMLIRAFKNLSAYQLHTTHYRLVIVGDGHEREKLEQLAAGDERIKFLGSKPVDELPEIYAEADMFVLPSNTETFGQVLLQAAAAGCAIIATKTTGASALLIHEKTGLLIDVGNQKELEQSIERLINNQELRMKLSENAQRMASEYDQEKAIQKLMSFWKKIAKMSID